MNTQKSQQELQSAENSIELQTAEMILTEVNY